MISKVFFCAIFPAILAQIGCSNGGVQSAATPIETTPAIQQSEATHTFVPSPTAEPAPTQRPEMTPTSLVTAREGRLFTYYGADPAMPIVARGPEERWDGKYINPGAMLLHDGEFHMFRNGFSDWPGQVSVGYMTSPDGLSWTEVQAAPVFVSDDVPYVAEGDGADVSSVIVTDDGNWVFYFHVVSDSEPAQIGRAVASSPLGPWQVDPEPVLSPGGEDSWDEGGVAWPSVAPTAGGYAMYYSGSPQGFGETMIGLATSDDGITWRKHDDPATMEAPFSESDPVLQPEESWTSDGVDRARVQHTPEGWVMIYQGGPLVSRGLAFSQDGVRWTRHPDNPVLGLEDFPFSGTMWDTALLFKDGTYYYYTEIGSMAATDIYLAVHEDEIVPAGLFEESIEADTPQLPAGVELLQLDEMVVEDVSDPPKYTRYLNTNASSLGVYALAEAATDTQPAHGEDELYYVIAGQANLDVDGESVPVSAGSLIYVRARIPHRFEDISDDLQVLVFFSKGDSEPDDPAWLAFHLEDLVAETGESGLRPFLETAALRAWLARLPAGAAPTTLAAGATEALHLVLEGEGVALIGEEAFPLSSGTLLLAPGEINSEFESLDSDLLLLILAPGA